MNQSKIKQARLNSGFTQSELAKEMDVTISTVSRWERGVLKLDGATKKLFEIIVINGKYNR